MFPNKILSPAQLYKSIGMIEPEEVSPSFSEPDECLSDGACINPFCPSHSQPDAWEGDDELHRFLFINNIFIGDMLNERVQVPGQITLRDGDKVEIRVFCGPVVNYETWREQ